MLIVFVARSFASVLRGALVDVPFGALFCAAAFGAGAWLAAGFETRPAASVSVAMAASVTMALLLMGGYLSAGMSSRAAACRGAIVAYSMRAVSRGGSAIARAKLAHPRSASRH